MEIIDELEPEARGPYAGAVGYLSFSGDLDTCITIRTLVVRDGETSVTAGAGIVADSDPEREERETERRRRRCSPPWRWRRRSRRRRRRWRGGGRGAMKLLMIDNYDSFTYNLVQMLAGAGAEVEVVRNDAEPVDELLARGGRRGSCSRRGRAGPEDAGVCLELVRRRPAVPLLGVCLGHQALGAAFGARWRAPRA